MKSVSLADHSANPQITAGSRRKVPLAPQIQTIYHTGFIVENLDKALDFYTRVLSFNIERAPAISETPWISQKKRGKKKKSWSNEPEDELTLVFISVFRFAKILKFVCFRYVWIFRFFFFFFLMNVCPFPLFFQ